MNKELLEKYLSGQCNDAEKQIVESWYDNYTQNTSIMFDGDAEAMDQSAKRSLTAINAEIDAEHISINDEQLGEQSPIRPIKRLRRWSWVAAAAAVLIVGGIWITYKPAAPKDQIVVNDVLPGDNKAILHLSDGRSIDLTEVDKNIALEQAGIEIQKSNDGELLYVLKKESKSNETPSKVLYNTISTPRTGRYAVVLPDGSKVTLNAESKLTYPVPFDKAERKIELNGEAYFEVAKLSTSDEKGGQQRVPFVVYAGEQRIEVLGTSFNVNAYADEEKTVTSLVEGKVAVMLTSNPKQSITLTPGLSAISNSKELHSETAHLESVTAWKNNSFYFRDQHISKIMRQLSRWYDVDFVLEKDINIDELYFSGVVSNDKNLSQVLRLMERTGTVKFKIEGRRVIVMD